MDSKVCNVFLVHSDFQLLLAALIKINQNNNTKSVLIYFDRGSNIAKNSLNYLKRLFNKIEILNEKQNFNGIINSLKNEYFRIKNIKKINNALKNYLVSDIFCSFLEDPFEKLIIKSISIPGTLIHYLDEGNGSYLEYDNLENLSELYGKYKTSYKVLSLLRDLMRFIQTGILINGSNLPVRYGLDKAYSDYYLILPQLFKYKNNLIEAKILGIDLANLPKVSLGLYNPSNILTNYSIKNKTIIIVLDGESILAPFSINHLKKIFEIIHNYGKENKLQILYKKHPIYNGYISSLKLPFVEIQQEIPIEFVFNQFKDNSPIIIGGSSTSLIIARALNLLTVSYYYIVKNSKVSLIGIDDYFNLLKIESPRDLSSFSEVLLNIN